uniref:Uncharacterized protein n=1 Tax=Vespula pensylvanica TaxID=30213 RepID=A0A834UHE6_VESPE|nr:hypothetical protein H0235_001806 [Vespula pensylvanica]
MGEEGGDGSEGWRDWDGVNPNCPVEANASSTAIFLLSVLSAFARARRHQVRAIGATVAAAVAGVAVETAAVAVVVVVASG